MVEQGRNNNSQVSKHLQQERVDPASLIQHRASDKTDRRFTNKKYRCLVARRAMHKTYKTEKSFIL